MEAADLQFSNSLVDLAARIKTEHTAVSSALKESLRHAIAAGELLLQAKDQVPHGQWLPWLEEHCSISERTAQLYMRVAKNRTEIENQIRNVIADLTLNEAAALLALSSDVRKLLQFAKEIDGQDPEAVIKACIEAGVAVIHSPNYNPLAGRNDAERREWALFTLYLAAQMGKAAASYHVEWLLQRPFQNVGEWLGPEGDKWHPTSWMRPIPDGFKRAWAVFAADHASLSETDIYAQLNAMPAESPRPVSRARPPRARRRE
jgi:hypothetical protein